MDVGADFSKQYETACKDLGDLGPVVEHLLKELLTAGSLRFHSVSHRVKSDSSVKRKLAEKGSTYDSLSDVQDLLGIRVITFFPDEVDKAAAIITNEFEIDTQNSVDKRQLLDPDRFGYLSLHYVASLSSDRVKLTEHSRFDGVRFEIQVRSILQHAWAEIEHDLGYHSPGAIPDSVRRRFSRLAGLLEIADDEFMTLRDEVSDYQRSVPGEISRAPESVPIDQDSLDALVSSGSDVLVRLDEHIAARFDAVLTEPGQAWLGRLASQLRWVGFETIGEVEDALETHEHLIKAFVERWASARYPEIDQGIALFYVCYVLVGKSGLCEKALAYLEFANLAPGDAGSNENLAQKVVATAAEAEKSIT